jgi:hypothetical protein
MFASPLHLRDGEAAGEGDGRTLEGLAIPFDIEIDVTDDGLDFYTEVFRRGAFAKTITDRSRPVPLLDHHQRRTTRANLGRATSLVETDEGLQVEFHLTEGVQAADEVLALVRDEAIGGLSIGFDPIQHREVRARDRAPGAVWDLIERSEVALREVSICNYSAYPGARITAVRDTSGGRPVATLVAERGQLKETAAVEVDRWNRIVRRIH